MKWQPMKRGQFVPLTDVQIAEHIRIAKEEHGQELTREGVLNLVKDDEVWLNARYQCAVKLLDNDPLGALHLSIKRRDKKPIHDWRDLQQIKNDVAGAEREALELYPAESRVVDLANQYHLWVVPVGQKIPVGWDNGRYLTDEVGRSGAKQRRRS